MTLPRRDNDFGHLLIPAAFPLSQLYINWFKAFVSKIEADSPTTIMLAALRESDDICVNQFVTIVQVCSLTGLASSLHERTSSALRIGLQPAGQTGLILVQFLVSINCGRSFEQVDWKFLCAEELLPRRRCLD
jgi:hypothetical protein